MTSANDFLSHLNPSQRQAVEHFCGPLLVVAGAGSGKTRALTYRIANLIRYHRVDPENILAVTFTNKAAKEMKERIERLFAQQVAQDEFGMPFSVLKEGEQMRLRSRVYKTYIKDLWVGTFHALCARILRFDIDKYQSDRGHTWTKQFSIFDESDAQSLVKDIVTNQLNLDSKKFDPRSVRFAISNAKNRGWSPDDLIREQPNYRGRVIAEVYGHYLDRLASNNGLDFDDLLLIPVRLFQQNETILGYWHRRFRHVLVDEYQDTNRTQYDLIRLLVTNGENPRQFDNWDQRSVFVVGDVDQCFPPDTPVLTEQGSKPIQSIAVGDTVLATAGQSQLLPAQVTHVHRGYFQGSLWCVRTGDQVLKGTPHHIVLSRMVPLADRYYVYLMYRADRGYRVGLTTGQRQGPRGKLEIGFKVRMNQEHADKLWVLKATDSYEEAAYYEAYFAAQYGLPTILFHGQGRNLKLTDEWTFKLFENVDTITNGHRLMQALWLHPEFPHHRPQNGKTRQTLNLTMFGNVRRERQPVKADHRVQWSSNREEIADNLTEAGFPIRAGKLPGTYRFETARASYREAVGLAQAAAEAGGLELRRRVQIDGEIYDFMPLSHLHPGMRLLLAQDGQLQEREVTEVWQEDYDGEVYDLEVDKQHTYVANGVLVHNSIYSFRAADFTILMEFQDDFGDRLPDDDTRTMVKLEENYRSTENILQVANALIQNNTERIDKVLRPTRGMGPEIVRYCADDEISEAEYVIQQMRDLEQENPELSWRNFAILYRTNAQSRAFEEGLVKWGVPYTVVGGLRFYDRREIKDMLAYLRAIANPFDTVSLLRVINVPRRGVGKTTIERLTTAAQELNLPLWEILSDQNMVKNYAGRSAKGVLQFSQQIQQWQEQLEDTSPSQMVDRVMRGSGYLQSLIEQDTEEADDRRKNLDELYNATLQFEEENEEATLLTFLASASLASDADSKDDQADRVSLMTLHSSKGLEFPIVFLVGLEQGLFPNYRSMDDAAAMEEERRLCYVGITRAQEQLFITHASARRLWGSREPAIPSCFLNELPRELIQSQSSLSQVQYRSVGTKTGGTKTTAKSGSSETSKSSSKSNGKPKAKVPKKAPVFDWKVGEKVLHRSFGVGQVTHVFGNSEKMSIAVKFPGSVGSKILDPNLAPVERLP